MNNDYAQQVSSVSDPWRFETDLDSWIRSLDYKSGSCSCSQWLSRFQKKKKICLSLSAGTFTSVFKNSKSSRSNKTVKIFSNKILMLMKDKIPRACTNNYESGSPTTYGSGSGTLQVSKQEIKRDKWQRRYVKSFNLKHNYRNFQATVLSNENFKWMATREEHNTFPAPSQHLTEHKFFMMVSKTFPLGLFLCIFLVIRRSQLGYVPKKIRLLWKGWALGNPPN